MNQCLVAEGRRSTTHRRLVELSATLFFLERVRKSLRERGKRKRLGHVARNAQLAATIQFLRGIRRSHDNDRERPCALLVADRFQYLETRNIRQLQIQKHGGEFFAGKILGRKKPKRFCAIPDHQNVLVHVGFFQFPKDKRLIVRIVLDDQNACQRFHAQNSFLFQKNCSARQICNCLTRPRLISDLGRSVVHFEPIGL